MPPPYNLTLRAAAPFARITGRPCLSSSSQPNRRSDRDYADPTNRKKLASEALIRHSSHRSQMGPVS
jgi:hypothetical protein